MDASDQLYYCLCSPRADKLLALHVDVCANGKQKNQTPLLCLISTNEQLKTSFSKTQGTNVNVKRCGVPYSVGDGTFHFT